jgi:predicted alpha/beta-hydrolase family hydrolase
LALGFTFDVADHGKTTALVYHGRGSAPTPRETSADSALRAPSASDRAAEPAKATLVLGHGAGAAQTHPFMVDIAKRISARGVDVVTFNFLYTEQGRKMPDRTNVLEACWHAVIASVRARGGLPTERLFCGGKSMGGRIVSNIAASPAGEGLTLSGLVFLGYPLHPPGKPKVRRDEHLPRIPFPMLFVQGSRDELGNAAEVRRVAKRLPNATVHVVEGGDHSLRLLARDGKARQEAQLEAAADAIAAFVSRSPRGAARRPRR